MNAIEFLTRWQRVQEQIENNNEKIERFRAMSYGFGSAGSGDRVQTSKHPDRMGDLLTDICLLEERNKELKRIQKQYECDILDKISKLTFRHRTILYKRYILGQSMSTIAHEEGITERGAKKARKRAVEELDKFLGNKTEIS